MNDPDPCISDVRRAYLLLIAAKIILWLRDGSGCECGDQSEIMGDTRDE